MNNQSSAPKRYKFIPNINVQATLFGEIVIGRTFVGSVWNDNLSVMEPENRCTIIDESGEPKEIQYIHLQNVKHIVFD